MREKVRRKKRGSEGRMSERESKAESIFASEEMCRRQQGVERGQFTGARVSNRGQTERQQEWTSTAFEILWAVGIPRDHCIKKIYVFTRKCKVLDSCSIAAIAEKQITNVPIAT